MERKQERKGSLLWELFCNMFYISAFTFGGGFVIVTLMKKKFVDEKGWITEEEMLDYTALAQSSPGAIAVNGAILVGWHLAGLPGMLTAVLATILPPMLILSVISLFYSAFATNLIVGYALRGMQAGVAAVIIDVVCSLGGDVLRKKSWFHTAIMGTAFLAAFFLKLSVIYIILAAAVLGILYAVFCAQKQKTEKKEEVQK